MNTNYINIFQRDLIVGDEKGKIENETISPVQIVTIKSKTPLFKGEEQANSIEKIAIEENGFSLVSQKDLYQLGDKAVYIQPDFSLSDISLFDSFIRPFGETKKSKLGSNFRIRAVKFNLHTGDNEPTYSVGILLPFLEVETYLKTIGYSMIQNGYKFAKTEDLSTLLGITKWEEPDNNGGDGLKTNGGRQYPSGVYKTDETNINNLWGHIENKIGYPLTLVGTKKTDGSSVSIIINDGKVQVGSRNLIKPWKINKVTGRRTPTLWERIKQFFGGEIDLLVKEEIENDDQFITLTKPYIEKLKGLYDNDFTDVKLILRGEASGQSWKGSGNKNNPDSKSNPNIKFFAADDIIDGIAIRMGEEEFDGLIRKFGFERCEVIFNKTFNSREELEKECKEYFKTHMIEGIVVKTLDGKFSAKFMNDEYDAKK